jgi:RNA polymerase sigma-70 factor (ECF subfamily)
MATEAPRAGDFAAQAIEHLDTLYRGALRLTRDPDQAQDLVQDTYARALRYQASFKPGTNLRAWLFAIMRNLFWDRFKGGQGREVSLDQESDEDFALYERLEDESAHPDLDVLDQIAAAEVVAAVDELPPAYREVVMLVDVEGFAYKDADSCSGASTTTRWSRASCTRRRNRHELQRVCGPAGAARRQGADTAGGGRGADASRELPGVRRPLRVPSGHEAAGPHVLRGRSRSGRPTGEAPGDSQRLTRFL